MQRTIGAFEAKTRLSELLEQVANGLQVTITKHNRPVAKLMPVSSQDKAQLQQTIQALKAFSQGLVWGDLGEKSGQAGD